MCIIEHIYQDDRSNEAVVVLNGESFKITAHDLKVLAISEGDAVDEDIIEMLSLAVERLSCIKKAFDHLSYGDLSEKQLRDKLARKFPKELSADVSALFVERGYVDDNKLAKRYAETFYEFKNMGLARIRNELYKRGISPNDIEDALADYEKLDQSERVGQFISKKYDLELIENDVKYRQKVYSGAIRAGFSFSDVTEYLSNFESE